MYNKKFNFLKKEIDRKKLIAESEKTKKILSIVKGYMW